MKRQSKPHHDSSGENGNGTPGALVVCGINHATATLSEREPFQITRQDLIPALKELESIRGVRESLVLSTCNRFEAYMVLDAHEEPFTVLRDFFIRLKGIDPKPLRSLFYVRHESTAVRHLFRVIGGLDSMVLGEYQIKNQVKEAYSAACSVKAPGKVLHRLFHAAFRTGKSVQTHTGLGAGRMSVAGMAVGIVEERLSPDDTVLLIGANENIRIVADRLKSAGFERFVFVNRTSYKARKLASRYGGEGSGLDELSDALKEGVGALVSCTSAPGFIVTAEQLEALAADNRCPGLLIDMAVPRDIERPETSSFPAELIDLEDLKACRKNGEQIREQELPRAESIVEDKVSTFQSWMENAFDEGTGALIKEYDRIRLARLKDALASFEAKDRDVLERFSRDLMQDFLKVPTQNFTE